MLETPSRAIPPVRRARPFLAFLPPLVAVGVRWALAPVMEPSVWFLFYPALFISSWIGDLRSSVLAAFTTTAAVWWLFVPPKYSLTRSAEDVVPAALLLATGILFAVFHDRVRKSSERLTKAVNDSRVFGALIANSSDFIGIADAGGKPVYLNPAGRRMIGLSEDFPIETTSIIEYYPPDQRDFASDVILKSMIESGHWNGETYFRNWRTGEAIPVSDSHFMIREPETARVIGMGTVTRDISEIRAARHEIEEANRRLAQANDEITLLYEKVTKLDALKTRFFANVSHEIRTPLALILGPVEKHLRAGTGLDPDLRRDLEVVERNARTVLRHVNDLLDVSRLDAGRLLPDYSDVDAAALVRLVADHFSTLATENRIDFVVETPAALRVQTDRDKLQRILLNLLSNAFKFTPGGGRVRVSLGEAGQRFNVEVADSGPGVPRDKRDAVFERFARIDESVRARPGTGLGLSIVKDFAGLLGGRVSVDDAPEGGALFALDLPSVAPPGSAVRADEGEASHAREVAQFADELRPPDRAAEARPAPAGGRRGRVLVVEDSREMNRFIADTLASDGFEALSAFDGREGYDTVRAAAPDLVLTDITMPIMSGDELVRRLRQQPEWSSMPIVVLTAKADEALRVRLLQDGAQDYLDKPFSVAELLARVRNLVARKQAEDRVNILRAQVEAVALASTKISEAVASLPEESVRTVLQTIALNAQNLTGAEFAAAGIGGDATHPFDIWAFVGMSPEQVAAVGRTPRAAGLLGAVSTANAALRLRDLREHPDHRGFPAHHPEMTSFLGMPIRYRDHAVGTLVLANKKGEAEFTTADQRIVEMLAARAGIAIETARLYAAEGKAHTWLQAVLDQTPEAIVVMNAEGCVTVENQALRALAQAAPPVVDRFGNTVTIDLRDPSGERLQPDDLPIVKAVTDHEVTRGRELLGRRADGRLVPLLASAAPILTADGAVDGAAMVLQDITTVKELQHLREEWGSIVAHDLRQPMSVISLRCALLMNAGLDEAQREHVRQIKASVQRLSRMARDLTDASLLESHRMQVTLDRLDVSKLVRDVIERVPLAASRTRIQTPPGIQLFIKGDAQRLEQVLENLLENAVKYGAPDTAVGVEVRPADGHAEIVVTNRGEGIQPEEIPLLFERYARSRAPKTTKTTGLGLGLYISKGLVEAHGGRIWARSVPGDVTAFHVAIPLDGPPAPDALAQSESAASSGALHTGRS